MIAVIVAGIALAIILGWTLSIQTPNTISRIEATPETIAVTGPPNQDAVKTVTITVRAFDQKGNPIAGIIVTLRGAGVADAALDEDDGAVDGTAMFPNVQVRLGENVQTTKIDVTVEASGFPTATDDIFVIRQ